MLPNRDFSMTALSAESSSFSAVNANPLRNTVPGPRKVLRQGCGRFRIEKQCVHNAALLSIMKNDAHRVPLP